MAPSVPKAGRWAPEDEASPVPVVRFALRGRGWPPKKPRAQGVSDSRSDRSVLVPVSDPRTHPGLGLMRLPNALHAHSARLNCRAAPLRVEPEARGMLHRAICGLRPGQREALCEQRGELAPPSLKASPCLSPRFPRARSERCPLRCAQCAVVTGPLEPPDNRKWSFPGQGSVAAVSVRIWIMARSTARWVTRRRRRSDVCSKGVCVCGGGVREFGKGGGGREVAARKLVASRGSTA